MSARMPSGPSWGRHVALGAGMLWTAPNTLVGLVAGVAGVLRGARMRWSSRDRAWVFFRYPWGPGGAMTLGNVILATADTLDVPCTSYSQRAGLCEHPEMRLGDHERAHVYQYMVLGPLFLPLYFVCGGIHVRNRFERAADRYALTGRGWWPWPTP
ncbi:hypothetical protein [Luteimonas abyssi]|uniref:hypothetical protein n=1 Tax=Luteimonas abyssi TaxID=1247514 RepID=UPI000737CF22